MANGQSLSLSLSLSLHRGTLELCQGEHRVFGHLPDEDPSPPIAPFGRATSSRKSLSGYHLRMIEATVFLVTFNAAELFWYPSTLKQLQCLQVLIG